MTDIRAFNSRGKEVYHYATPLDLTDEEINKDLRDWGVNPETHNVMVKRDER